VIRPATRADAAAIARVNVATWQFAYAEIIDPEHLTGLDVDERAAVWEQLLGDGTSRTWVAEISEQVVGFVNVEGERLKALYVDPVAQGAGVGSALLAEAERAGAGSLQVFAANGHAREFYEARGWRLAGDDGAWLDRPLVRYVRHLRDRGRDTGGGP
jgi:ribosomal protein S18 acetylase RimI-like enzyme